MVPGLSFLLDATIPPDVAHLEAPVGEDAPHEQTPVAPFRVLLAAHQGDVVLPDPVLQPANAFQERPGPREHPVLDPARRVVELVRRRSAAQLSPEK